MNSMNFGSARMTGKKHYLMVATCLGTGLLAPAAWAEEMPATSTVATVAAAPQSDPAPARSAEEEIVVTGSRTAAAGFNAPSAVSVVGSEDIRRQAPTTIAEVLAQEPSFKASRSAGGNGNNFSSPGQATADLRGLGGQRTLVLIDGSRIVPQAPAVNTGVPVTTDLNVIPTNMIERVEVVTGGASAQYGSDAVAGVVNLILRKKFEGLELNAQSGISQEGDNFRYKIGAVGGVSFADGRGNLVVSGEMTQSSEINDVYSRKWGARAGMAISNPNLNTTNPNLPGFGLPALIASDNVFNSNSIGGQITTTGFRYTNYTFEDNGTIRPLNVGAFQNGGFQLGGEGFSRTKGSSLTPGVKRYVAYARFSYEFSPALTLIAEGGYSKTDAFFSGGAPNTTGNGFTIQRDNAYLPQVVRDAMFADTSVLGGRTSITVARTFTEDLGNINFNVTNKTPHGTIGVEGDLGGSWHYDAHYSYGQNEFRSDFTNNFTSLSGANPYSFAVDAVFNGAGQIVCRATRDGSTNPLAAGCVPLNIFGPTAGLRSQPGAIDYVNRSGFNAVMYKQHSAAFNLRGNLFSTWAGPIAVAAGGEYRKESQDLTADALATASRFVIGNAAPFSGKFDVKEGYFEALVPLARDVPFLKSLDVNGAIRYADYSTAGGQTTWKVGGVWEPVDGLRFRVTRSRDIRAPALYELFSKGSQTLTSLTVDMDGPGPLPLFSGLIPQNRTIGNPALRPEKANTLTLGVVAQPRGIPGLRASVDYYNIDLRDAIDSLSAATIGSLCTGGDQTFCNIITTNSVGVPISLSTGFRNLGSFKSSGIDMAVSYRMGLGSETSLTTRFSGTYALHVYVNPGTPGAASVDRSGENGQANLGAIPRFRGNVTETLESGPFSLSAQLLFISAGTNDNLYTTERGSNGLWGPLSINDNSVPAFAYINLFSSFKVNDQFEFGINIDNLLNKDPAFVPYQTQGQATSGAYYDKIGRTFEVTARVKF